MVRRGERDAFRSQRAPVLRKYTNHTMPLSHHQNEKSAKWATGDGEPGGDDEEKSAKWSSGGSRASSRGQKSGGEHIIAPRQMYPATTHEDTASRLAGLSPAPHITHTYSRHHYHDAASIRLPALPAYRLKCVVMTSWAS